MADPQTNEFMRDINVSDVDSIFKTGYHGWTSPTHVVLNFLFTLLMIILSLPAFIGIALLIRLTSRGPVFYKGIRLGIDKKAFRHV